MTMLNVQVPLLDREAGVLPSVPSVPQTTRESEERVPKTLSTDAAFSEAEAESGQAEPDVPVPRAASREGYYQHQYTDNFSNWYYARHGF